MCCLKIQFAAYRNRTDFHTLVFVLLRQGLKGLIYVFLQCNVNVSQSIALKLDHLLRAISQHISNFTFEYGTKVAAMQSIWWCFI